MVSDAEAHAAEDKARRQDVEIRNAADTAVYQVQRQMNEAGSRLPVHEKSRIEQLLNDTRQALRDNAPTDRIRSLTSDLTQAANAFSQSGTAAEPQAEKTDPDQNPGGPDDVIDAEYTEK